MTTNDPLAPDAALSDATGTNSWVVDAQSVTKKFRQGEAHIAALENVSLSVRQGEFVAIMGASGSGKSTLLHLLAGLTRPDHGLISIAGTDILKMSDGQLTSFRRRHIGIVFQAFNLMPNLTVADNILLPSQCRGEKQQTEQRLDDLLNSLGLSGSRQRFPDSLSGGEQQRVAIARALIGNPAVVLADEPTGSLDSVTGQRLCEQLRRLKERNEQSILLVTHDPMVAMWSDRVVILKDGQAIDSFATATFSEAKELAKHFFDLNYQSDSGESH